MSGSRLDDCGSKHLRWATAIIGIVLAICTATVAYCHSMVGSLEVRVRQIEKNDAANAARFESIKASLDRLERRAN